MGTQDESQLAEIESLANAKGAVPLSWLWHPKNLILKLARKIDVPQAGGGSRSGM